MSRPPARLLAVALIAALALSGCAMTSKPTPTPTSSLPRADDVMESLARAFTALDLTDAPLLGDRAAETAELKTNVAGMDDFEPTVIPGSITYDEGSKSAASTLTWSWPLPSGTWTYAAPVSLTLTGDQWDVQWSPTLIHPQLTSQTRLSRSRKAAQRAPIVGDGGQEVVASTTVSQVGIDKTLVDAGQLDASARQLAAICGLDPDAYAAQVAAAGSRAFVVAVTYRIDQVPTAIMDVPGARGIRTTSMLAPTRDFAQPILGLIGEASADAIAKSKGMIGAGDLVGVTGIQSRFDDKLRGTPGDTVVVRAKEDTSPASSTATAGQPAGDASAVTPGAGVTTDAPGAGVATAAPAPNPPAPVTVYQKDPVRADPLQISLDVAWQMKAESVLAGVQSPASAVVIRPSTGAILAAANSPGSAGQPDANWGAYAPGSTFKLVTALALLRHGFTPESTVDCPATVMIGGQTFQNTPGYPAAHTGSITLKDAFAYSCNTAFMNAAQSLAAADFTDAAGSLGLGVDYTTGAQINFGTIPAAESQAQRAQEAIGQGGVLVSPIAMAGVVASVVAGKTTIPWVVALQKPLPTAAPLTKDEAAQLMAMMGQVVAVGSAKDLADILVGAKTGTAEWGDAPPYKTHAWMLGVTDHDIAVVVWVKDGASGAATAGPIVRQLVQEPTPGDPLAPAETPAEPEATPAG